MTEKHGTPETDSLAARVADAFRRSPRLARWQALEAEIAALEHNKRSLEFEAQTLNSQIEQVREYNTQGWDKAAFEEGKSKRLAQRVVLLRAEKDSAVSLLLEVQQECITLRTESITTQRGLSEVEAKLVELERDSRDTDDEIQRLSRLLHASRQGGQAANGDTFRPRCAQCNLPMSRNQHPRCHEPGLDRDVGAPYECIPCMKLTLHAANERAMGAEADKNSDVKLLHETKSTIRYQAEVLDKARQDHANEIASLQGRRGAEKSRADAAEAQRDQAKNDAKQLSVDAVNAQAEVAHLKQLLDNATRVVRQEVHDFATEMERVLRDNDHKGGWEDCTPAFLIGSLVMEVAEVALQMFHSAMGQSISAALHSIGETIYLDATESTHEGVWEGDWGDVALLAGRNNRNNQDVLLKEPVDVANFAMMIWERMCAHREEPPSQLPEPGARHPDAQEILVPPEESTCGKQD